MSDMVKLFEAARRVSVPIVVVRSADQLATVQAMAAVAAAHPMVAWDAAFGLGGLTGEETSKELPGTRDREGKSAGAKALRSMGVQKAEQYAGFVEMLLKIEGLPQGAVAFALNAHRQLHSSEPMGTAAAIQAVANLRDLFKKNYRTLVLLGPAGFVVPPELDQDVVVLDHELPGQAELGVIVDDIQSASKKASKDLPALTSERRAKAVEAISGLSAFSAEQVVAMSYEATGLNVDALWDRKYTIIDNVRGMSAYRGRDTFDDLRGLDSVKAKFRARLKAKTPVGVVVWVDEGADVFQNVEHDTSGVKTDQQRALLVEMENNGWPGVILTGVPGSGKSALARAFGNEAGVPTIALDFGDMEGSLVGESEAHVRTAIKTVKAIGQGHAFFVLTCNSLAGIRPQFMRRFKKGVYFFDMPTAEERAAIWALYLKKFSLPKQPLPNDDGWTGAEIRECCEEAWDVSCTLKEAAVSIIPVSRSRADVIEEMRRGAHGRFLDANKPGTYTYAEEPMQRQVRAITLPPAVAAVLPPVDKKGMN